MKLVKFSVSSEEGSAPGVLSDGKVRDLRDSTVVKGNRSPLANAIENLHKEGIGLFKNIEGQTHEADEVSLEAPVPSEGRVICLGGVYAQHLRERNDPLNQVPSQWIAPEGAVVGPDEAIVLPERVKENVMPAVELGIVIGAGCRYITEADVSDVIAGYTICNDITARTDWPGPMAYKLMDTFWPTGPAITPDSHVSNPMNLELRLEKDGKEICRGTSASMRFSISFVVSHISSIFKLRPGDIISAGDPGGVESAVDPGTEIKAIIDEVGELSNPVVEEN